MARDITVKFKGDSSDLEGDARRAATAMDKFGTAQKRATDSAGSSGGKLGGLKGALGSLGGMAKVAGGNMVANLAGTAATAVMDFASDSIQAASRLQQAQGGVDAVFGKSASIVDKYASTSADRLGLAGAEYRELATVAGSQLKNAGQSTDQAAKSTDGLITKAADLSATFGGSTKEAMEAISSLMKGETDPIEKYGVSIKQTDVNARMAAEGHDKLTGAAKKSAESQARLALLTEQTSAATGAFAKESDTLAGKQERANAKMEDAKAKLGEALLPAMTAITGFMADTFIPAITALSEKIGPLIDMIGEKLGPAFTTMMGYVQPVIDALIVLWEKFGHILITFVVEKVQAVIQTLKGAFDVIRGIVNVFVGIFTGDWAKAWDGIKQIVSGAWNMILGIFKQILGPLKMAAQLIWETIKGIFRTGRDAVVRFVSELPGKAAAALSSLGSTLWNIAKAAWAAMGRAVTGGINDVVSWVSRLPGRIYQTLRGMADAAWHIGSDFIRGIGNGIGSMLNWLIRQAENVAMAPVNAVKNILHIGSPSKVMENLGMWTIRGYADGIRKASPSVANAMLTGPIKAAYWTLAQAKEHMRDISEGGGRGNDPGWRQSGQRRIADAQNRLNALLQAQRRAAVTPSYSSGPYIAPAYRAAPSAAARQVTVNVAVSPMSNPVAAGRATVEALQAYERMNGTKWRQTA